METVTQCDVNEEVAKRLIDTVSLFWDMFDALPVEKQAELSERIEASTWFLSNAARELREKNAETFKSN